MKKLYILRHAKAVQEDSGGDAARKLAPSGRKAAAAMGAFIAQQPLPPTLVLCSSAARTRETLAQILPALQPAPRTVYEDGLYLASPKILLQHLQDVGDDIASVLLVAHNPGVHELALRLARDPAKLGSGFPTCALAVFEVPGCWHALEARTGSLTIFQTPKMLNQDLGDD